MQTVTLAVLLQNVNAQFGFFDHFFQQAHHGPQKPQRASEESNTLEKFYYQLSCDKHLCEDTLMCVNSPIDCPCPFESSQLKCVLPGKKSYVCISKPTTPDGPDCQYILTSYADGL